MRNKIINDVLMRLGEDFTENQRFEIKQILTVTLATYDITKATEELVVYQEDEKQKLVKLFIVTKKIEGCTDKTLKYYSSEVRKFAMAVNKPWAEVTADDIRLYIAQKAIKDKVSKATQDNVLRILRSFFGWLSAEEHIPKNPTVKIKRIRAERRIKKPFTEVEIEKLRNGARNLRERAMIDLLLSTGMRIGELEGLNRRDIEGDQCIVYGKGEKERYVYLNAKAIVSLEAYLKTRTDDNEALFVSDIKPYNRLRISGFETRIRELGQELGIDNVHPHRFRRTAATLALNRGMPIDQVQKMLGHEQIATTLIYAQAAQENVKQSHKKYLS